MIGCIHWMAIYVLSLIIFWTICCWGRSLHSSITLRHHLIAALRCTFLSSFFTSLMMISHMNIIHRRIIVRVRRRGRIITLGIIVSSHIRIILITWMAIFVLWTCYKTSWGIRCCTRTCSRRILRSRGGTCSWIAWILSVLSRGRVVSIPSWRSMTIIILFVFIVFGWGRHINIISLISFFFVNVISNRHRRVGRVIISIHISISIIHIFMVVVVRNVMMRSVIRWWGMLTMRRVHLRGWGMTWIVRIISSARVSGSTIRLGTRRIIRILLLLHIIAGSCVSSWGTSRRALLGWVRVRIIHISTTISIIVIMIVVRTVSIYSSRRRSRGRSISSSSRASLFL